VDNLLFLNSLGFGRTGIDPSIRTCLFANERHGSTFSGPEMQYFVQKAFDWNLSKSIRGDNVQQETNGSQRPHRNRIL
jgi:hypothetical protein